MNILNKAALESLKKSRTRTFVTIIGVILSAAMFTAVATFGVSLLHYMINGAIARYGSWHVQFSNVDADFIQSQAADSRVANVASYQNIGYAQLNGSENPDKPYLYIAGFSADTFNTVPVVLLSGRMPENSNEVIASASISANGGVTFAVGDTLTLDVGTRTYNGEALSQRNAYTDGEALEASGQKTYTVTGICQRPTFEPRAAAGYTLITLSDTNSAPQSVDAFVTLKNVFSVRSYVKSVNANYTLNDNVLRFMGLSGDKLFTSFLYAVGACVMAIIMVGSVFLIYNAFNISLTERMHQFGILSSVGATAKQLRASVLFEGLCIGIISIPIGILIGLVCIWAIIGAVAEKFAYILYSNVPLTLYISYPTLICAAVISLVTILISAYIPAKKAAAAPIMDCIRQTGDIAVSAKSIKISRLSKRIYGIEGTLALKNFKRSKKRCRGIILSLVLSIVLFITTNSFVVYLTQAAEQTTVYTTYDIGVSTDSLNEAETAVLYNQLKACDGVTASAVETLKAYTCKADKSVLSDTFYQSEAAEQTDIALQLLFISDDAYAKIVADAGLDLNDFTGTGAKLLTCAKIKSSLDGAHGDYVDLFNTSALDTAIYPKAKNAAKAYDVQLVFADIVPPDSLPSLTKVEAHPYFFTACVPYSRMTEFSDGGANLISTGLTFNTSKPLQTASKMEQLIAANGLTSRCTLYNMTKVLAESRNYIFIANIFSYTFIVMISLIAVANVFNTISTNIKLRRRELAMLRSVGMSDRAFNKMMRFECAFYGMRALAIGLPLSILFSALIYAGMFYGGAETLSYQLPWKAAAISILSVLLIIFATMMYSVSKIKKENIIDALRCDIA